MLSIVILNWNGVNMLRTYLPSVVSNSPGADIIVADNASTDDSLEMLRKEFPTVRTIVLDRNYGFADGYNKALKALDEQYVSEGSMPPHHYILLNSDVRVPSGWIAPLESYMDTHPETAACQPKLLSVTSPHMFEYAGACGGFIDHYGYPYCRGRVFDTVEEDEGQYDDVVECLWATGACLMIRREDYWAAGGLDGRFFAHNEEIDLCWRLNLLGRKVVCVPRSSVYHLGGGTLPKSNARKTYLNFRNNLTMLYKNLPDEELRSIMLCRMFLDYLAAFQMLILGRSYSDFKAILKARHDFRKWKKEFFADRKKIQSTSVTKHPSGLTGINILWQYYVKGRKTFRQIG